MTFEIWSGLSGNLVGAYASEGEALAAVQRAVRQNGPQYIESLALIVENDAGESALVAEGRELVRRVSRGPAVAH